MMQSGGWGVAGRGAFEDGMLASSFVGDPLGYCFLPKAGKLSLHYWALLCTYHLAALPLEQGQGQVTGSQ